MPLSATIQRSACCWRVPRGWRPAVSRPGNGRERDRQGTACARPARIGSAAQGPFVAVNCGTLARELAESQLFGHERGAFTGAGSRRAGWFEEAAGGTLVLDEIGELPMDLQPKLLRALETGRIRRVGGSGETAVEVRVVATTLRDLRRDTQRGSFRLDLSIAWPVSS